MIATDIIEKCKQAGIHQYAVIKSSEVPFEKEVREMCAVNRCGLYGKSWCCPPGVGTEEECREKCGKYENVFVFSTKHELEDSFDFEGMTAGKARHQEISHSVREIFRREFKDILVLSSEGCGKCEQCTYPDAPCRFPDEMSPSVESYGIMVYKEAQIGGINYINGVNTVTYFSNIFF